MEQVGERPVEALLAAACERRVRAGVFVGQLPGQVDRAGAAETALAVAQVEERPAAPPGDFLRIRGP